MNDKTTLDALSAFLVGKGFTSKLVQRSSSKTPDLFVGDGEDSYLLEVKRRHDSRGPLFIRTDPLKRLNSLSELAARAASQLKSGASGNAIRMLWFLGQPPYQKTFYDQLRMTLYGIRIVIGLRNGKGIASACYYAGHSDFYRYRHVLDGALLGTVAAVFINDYSPHADRLKNSRLCRLAESAILDPRDLEKSEEALVLRDSVDRSDDAAVLQCIEKTYGIENAKFEQIVKFSVLTQ